MWINQSNHLPHSKTIQKFMSTLVGCRWVPYSKGHKESGGLRIQNLHIYENLQLLASFVHLQ